MNNLLLSIIIPVYNVEEYIEECVDSIVNQSNKYKNLIEIILIDDGTRDNSGKICDAYEKKYSFIKVFHKQNEGLSETRNYGLRKSSGKYVWFVDSDDYICENSLNKILTILGKDDIDIVLGDANVVDAVGNFTKKLIHRGLISDNKYSGLETIKYQLEQEKNYIVMVWVGIYRRQFLIDNNLYFEKGLIHEDELWTPITLINASKIIYKNILIYNYRIRANSIMRDNKNSSIHVKTIIYVLNKLNEYVDNFVNDKHTRNLIKDNIARRYLYNIVYWNFYKYPELYKTVNTKQIFLNSRTFKNKIRSVILLINRNLYSKIFKFLKQVL